MTVFTLNEPAAIARARGLIGRPCARGDCLPLVVEVYGALGIEFELPEGWPDSNAEQWRAWTEQGEPIHEPATWCIVDMSDEPGGGRQPLREASGHCGLLMPGGKVFHGREATGAVLQRLTTLERAGVVSGFWHLHAVREAYAA